MRTAILGEVAGEFYESLGYTEGKKQSVHRKMRGNHSHLMLFGPYSLSHRDPTRASAGQETEYRRFLRFLEAGLCERYRFTEIIAIAAYFTSPAYLGWSFRPPVPGEALLPDMRYPWDLASLLRRQMGHHQ